MTRDNFRIASEASRRAKTHGEESMEIYEAARRAIDETRELMKKVADQTASLKEKPE